ncbi:MAG TPA: GNAT family N-acetyltransferase [Casimicrobiaceae bacterium]|nr:GNAT family N-acetyltransferase [Casimicrobiaceae bacterium]
MNAATPIEVRHDERASRFEATVDGLVCFAAYDRQDDVLRMNHTSVPEKLEGRGIAAVIVRFAFEYARANGLRVEPWCSYVRTYMRRHPETHSLLTPGFRL